MPNLYTYYLVIGETTTELTTDPKGWQEHSIAFSRSEDFGLNIEHTVPLSFSDAGRTLIKAEYDSKGIFAAVNVLIKKRNNDWTISNFYEYKLDFTTYNDTLEFIEITGIEIGLLSKLMAYRDTEYDIDLPTTGKTFMSYTGVTINKKNLIQCGYGKTIELPHEDWYSPTGTRSVSTYNDKISFLDANGLPWKHMMFQVLEAGTYKIRVKLNLKIRIQYPFGEFTAPESKPMWLLKHNAAMTSVVSGDVLHEFTPTASDANNILSRRTDGFIGYDVTNDYSISIDKPYVSLVYPQNNGTYLKVAEVMEGFNTFIEVSNDVESQYNAASLEYVTHQWLIGQLLNKIYPSNTLTYSLTHTNFLPALISDDCIRNLGKATGTGKFTVKLSDVLKSLDVLECIGIDITGSVMTIAPRANMYSGTKYKSVTAKNIAVKADISHIFNKISVGWDTKKNDKDSDLTYPFNCKKTFEIPQSPVENELDLVNPFIGDCYEIEKHFDDIFSSETNSDKSDVCVIALKNIPIIPVADESYSTGLSTTFEYIFDEGDPEYIPILGYNNSPPAQDTKILFSQTGEYISFGTQETVRYTVPKNGIYKFELDVIAECQTSIMNFRTKKQIGGADLIFDTVITDTEVNTPGVDYNYFEAHFNGNIYLYEGNWIDISIEHEHITGEITVSPFTLKVTNLSVTQPTERDVYKEHTISNFSGIASTVFNVPITPKRILNKHLAYISVSAHGSSNDITFVSTELDSAITSQCDFEAGVVIENADVTPVTPLFIPSILSFETQEKLISLTTVQSNKYKYIEVEDEKTGNIYAGWINNITFAVGKNKTQNWDLQSK